MSVKKQAHLLSVLIQSWVPLLQYNYIVPISANWNEWMTLKTLEIKGFKWTKVQQRQTRISVVSLWSSPVSLCIQTFLLKALLPKLVGPPGLYFIYINSVDCVRPLDTEVAVVSGLFHFNCGKLHITYSLPS